MTAPQILAVCTGNICRSPAIERLLVDHVWPYILVSSAGTRAVIGSPISAPMAQLLESANARVSGFEARQITGSMIDEADLILTATASHRSAVVTMQPTAMKKTFTLLEFAYSASTVKPATMDMPLSERIPALIEHAAHTRPRIRTRGVTIDIPDPYGHSDEAYHTAFSVISRAVQQIYPLLTPH